jgi:hypothetical protein
MKKPEAPRICIAGMLENSPRTCGQSKGALK